MYYLGQKFKLTLDTNGEKKRFYVYVIAVLKRLYR